MPFYGSLTSNQLESLRGESITGSPRFHSEQYISLSTNLEVFVARVNQSAFASSFADITYDNVTTGAYTDIDIGMTVYLSTTNDKRNAYFVGRVRLDPTSSVLYINQTSVEVSDNDYIFVCNDHRTYEKLFRYDSSTEALYEDYDNDYHQLAPLIYGLQSAYAGFVSGSPSGLTIAFSASAIATANGASISSYAWTLPSGTTVTAGNVSTANVTVRFDEAEDEYWVKLVVTDDNSNTSTRWIPVWAHGDTYKPATGFNGATITGELDTGFNGTISGFDGIDDVLDGTVMCIWSVDYYNGSEETINTNVNLVGQFTRDTSGASGDDQYSTLLQDAEFVIEGAGGILTRLTAPTIEILNNGSPTEWGQVDTLTVWREIVYVLQTSSNFLDRYSLQFDNVDNTFRDKGEGTQGTSLLDCVTSLSERINAYIEFAPDGACRVVRDARYLTTAQRSGLTTVADFDSRDMFNITIEHEQEDVIGRVESSGGFFNTNSNESTPLLSVAPGVTQGSGAGNSQFNRQQLASGTSTATAQSELNQRAGHHYAYMNARYRLSLGLPDGYYFLAPSRNMYYTWDIDSDLNNRGIAFGTGTNWLLERVTHTHDNGTGVRDVQVEFSIETIGQAGDTVQYPVQNEIDISVPPLPDFSVYPEFPPLAEIQYPSTDPADLPPVTNNPNQTAIPTDGNYVVIWDSDGDHLWYTDDFKVSTSNNWREVTPSLATDEIIIQAVFAIATTRLYVLTNDTTNERSRIWTTDNPFTTAPSWSTGTWINDEYDVIRTTSVQGEIIAQISNSQVTTIESEYFGGNGNLTAPYTLAKSVDIVSGSCTPTYNLAEDRIDGCTPAPTTGVGFNLQKSYPSVTMTAISMTIEWNKTRTDDVDDLRIELNGGTVASENVPDAINSGTTVVSWSGSTVVTALEIDCSVRNNNDSDGSYCRLVALSITTGASTGEVYTRYSDTDGASFGIPETVGSSLLATIGFDTVKIGLQALCGRSGGVEINTDLSDDTEDYALYGSVLPTSATAKCIVVPRYQPNTATTDNSNTDTPQYILASSVLSAGSESVWLVDNDGNDFNDITPNNGGNEGLAVSPNCMVMPFRRGNKIATIFNYNGTRRLFTNNGTFGNWNDEQVLGDNADYIRMRKADTLTQELYYVDDVPYLSVDFGVTVVARSYPDDESTNPCAGIEVYG